MDSWKKTQQLIKLLEQMDIKETSPMKKKKSRTIRRRMAARSSQRYKRISRKKSRSKTKD